MTRIRFLLGALFASVCLLVMAPTTNEHQRSLLEDLIFSGTNGECWVRNDAVTGGGNWDSCATGGGDNVLVDTAATVDPDFQDGDVDFTYAAGVVTATVACTGCIDDTDMAADSVGTSEIINASIGTLDIAPDAVGPSDLDLTANPVAGDDEYCVTYEHSTTEFELQACSSGGGDSITVNSGATVDPNFLDGDIDWTYAGTDITATVGCSQCVSYSEVQNVSTTNRLLGRDTAGAGVIEEITMEAALDMVTTWASAVLYHNSGGAWGPTNWTTDGTNITPTGDASGNLGSGVLRWAALYAVDVISPDGVDVTDLDFVSDPGAGQDEYCVTYEHATGNFEAQVCSSGGGDSVSVDSAATVDPDFQDGDVDFTYAAGVVTATVGCSGCIDATDIAANAVDYSEIAAAAVRNSELDVNNSTTDEHCLTWEDGVARFEWQKCVAPDSVTSTEVDDSSLYPSDLYISGTATDEYVLTYETALGNDFQWESVCDIAWPVDSIYISMSSTNPGTTFGCGTWSAFATGRMLIGVDGGKSWSSAGATGGNTDMQHEHTLDEIVSHTHSIPAYNHGTGSTAGKVEVTNSATASSATTGSTGTGATVNTNTEVTPGTSTGTDPVPWIAVYMWRRTA